MRKFMAAALGAASFSAAENIFANKEHLDIYLNQHVHDLQSVIDESDQLVFVYLKHSDFTSDSHGQNWSMLDNLFLKVLEDLKGGYVKTFVIDCADKHEVFDPSMSIQQMCYDREEFSPIFNLYKPSEIAINPYTGKKMPTGVINYPSNQIGDIDVRNWITNNIPDYTQRLSTMEDFEQFESEADIAKVYLFSTKQKVPPIFKALAQHFRNRLRFAFVSSEASASTEIAKQLGSTKWPTMLVKTADGEVEVMPGEKMKLDAMREFVAPFALQKGQEKDEFVIKSKRDTAELRDRDLGYEIFTLAQDLEERVLASWEAGLVYVTMKDNMEYLDILEGIAKQYNEFMRFGVFVVEDLEAASNDLKKEFKTTKLP